MKPENSLTQARLRELLNIDAETFQFTWKVHRQCIRAGSPAGSVKPHGYQVIVADGRPYMAHRLVWLHEHGVFPAGTIDHVNGVRADNRIDNLRDVPFQVNMQNQPRPRRVNRTGYAGVTPHGKGFQASVRIHGKRVNPGTYGSPEEAYEACVNAKLAAGAIPIKSVEGMI